MTYYVPTTYRKKKKRRTTCKMMKNTCPNLSFKLNKNNKSLKDKKNQPKIITTKSSSILMTNKVVVVVAVILNSQTLTNLGRSRLKLAKFGQRPDRISPEICLDKQRRTQQSRHFLLEMNFRITNIIHLFIKIEISAKLLKNYIFSQLI